MNNTFWWRIYSIAVFIQFVVNVYFFPKGFNGSDRLLYSSRTPTVDLWINLERISMGFIGGGSRLLVSSVILIIFGLAIAHFAREEDPPLAKSIIITTILVAGLPVIGMAIFTLCYMVALIGA